MLSIVAQLLSTLAYPKPDKRLWTLVATQVEDEYDNEKEDEVQDEEGYEEKDQEKDQDDKRLYDLLSTTILITFANTLYVFRQDPMKHRSALKPTRMRQSGWLVMPVSMICALSQKLQYHSMQIRGSVEYAYCPGLDANPSCSYQQPSSVFAFDSRLKMKWADGQLKNDTLNVSKPDFSVHNLSGSSSALLSLPNPNPRRKPYILKLTLLSLPNRWN